jgi:HK97 family phage major capsid protein
VKDTKTMTDELRELLKGARDIAAKADDENRDLTAEERTAIEANMAKAAGLKGKVAIESALNGLEGEIETIEGKARGSVLAGAAGFAGFKARSLGRAFTEADDTKAWLADVAPTGQVHEKARVQSPAFGFNGLKAFGYGAGTGRPSGAKALVTGTDDESAGALVDADFLGLVDEGAYARPLNILDVITRGSTDSDTVEYVRVTSVTNAAAPVVEASTAGAIPEPDEDNTAGVKPESGLALLKITEAVKTIAHWLPATRRALSDAAQIRTLIDNFLRYGLFEEIEDQIVNGDGSGENFTGILNTPGVQVQTWDTDFLATARKAKTKVRVVGRAVANAYLLHPNDAERLDLLKDNEGRYYYGGPAQDGAQPLWRLPVVETEAVTEGVGLCGDFRRAVLWDREQAAISVSDSHADFFIRNLIAILAELRAAFGVFRPAAFVQFPTTSTSSSAA